MELSPESFPKADEEVSGINVTDYGAMLRVLGADRRTSCLGAYVERRTLLRVAAQEEAPPEG